MGRSGERARNFKRAMSRLTSVPDKPMLSRPGWDHVLTAGVHDEVTRIYRMLGGTGAQPRVAPGAWDLQVDDLAVELDEENHFNRYRALTLASPLYGRLGHLDTNAYGRWSEERESACLTYGKYWSNESCEHEFGQPGPRSDLSGAGASSAPSTTSSRTSPRSSATFGLRGCPSTRPSSTMETDRRLVSSCPTLRPISSSSMAGAKRS